MSSWSLGHLGPHLCMFRICRSLFCFQCSWLLTGCNRKTSIRLAPEKMVIKLPCSYVSCFLVIWWDLPCRILHLSYIHIDTPQSLILGCTCTLIKAYPTCWFLRKLKTSIKATNKTHKWQFPNLPDFYPLVGKVCCQFFRNLRVKTLVASKHTSLPLDDPAAGGVQYICFPWKWRQGNTYTARPRSYAHARHNGKEYPVLPQGTKQQSTTSSARASSMYWQ